VFLIISLKTPTPALLQKRAAIFDTILNIINEANVSQEKDTLKMKLTS